MNGMIIKAIRYYEEHGILQTIRRCFEKIGFVFCYKKLICFCVDLSQWNYTSHNVDDIIIERLDREKVNNMQEYYDGWHNKEKAMLRLQKGKWLFGARHGNSIVNYIWIDIITTYLRHFHIVLSLPNATACLAYAYTIKSERGRGKGTFAAQNVLHMLRQQGYTRVITFVRPVDSVSLTVKQKIGFQKTCSCTYIRFMFLKFYFCKSFHSQAKKFIVIVGRDGNKLLNALTNL